MLRQTTIIENYSCGPVNSPRDPVDLVYEAARLVFADDLDAARAMIERIGNATLENQREAAHQQVRERLAATNRVAPQTRP